MTTKKHPGVVGGWGAAPADNSSSMDQNYQSFDKINTSSHPTEIPIIPPRHEMSDLQLA